VLFVSVGHALCDYAAGGGQNLQTTSCGLLIKSDDDIDAHYKDYAPQTKILGE
jgi:hypothetical protein